MYNMIQTAHTFRAVPRPKGVLSCYSLIVIDENGRPHLPLTRFYYETQQALLDGTARTYLNTLLPYFTYLATDGWRQRRGDQWDSAPEAVRESARDYLVCRLLLEKKKKFNYTFFIASQLLLVTDSSFHKKYESSSESSELRSL